MAGGTVIFISTWCAFTSGACGSGSLRAPWGDLLDIGPYYAFTPFVLAPYCRSVLVIEGDDPAVDRLRTSYSKRSIDLRVMDFNELFGPMRGATRTLPYADNSFDTVVFWETLEDFSFNPVPFLRDLARIVRPGGRVIAVVPNRAALFNIYNLFCGNLQQRTIQSLVEHADTVCDGKFVYHGHHWREYTLKELCGLFSSCGFDTVDSGHILGFMKPDEARGRRRTVQSCYAAVFKMLPVLGTDVYIDARVRPRSGDQQS